MINCKTRDNCGVQAVIMTQQIAVYSVLHKLPSLLKAALPQLQFHVVEHGAADALGALQKAEIIIADGFLLSPIIHQLPNAKWIQCTYAGVENIVAAVDKTKLPLPFVMTRLTGDLFGVQMAEYVVSEIVNRERNLFTYYDYQKIAKWGKESFFPEVRTMMDLTIGIMGFGEIGKDIARTLKSLRAEIWALVRKIPEDKEKLAFVDNYRKVEDLPEFLQKCDYVINVLPSTPQTTGLLNADLLKNCASKETVFINIGRASVVKEEDLITALENKWLSAAILDVFEKEPLPPDNPLWKMPQVTVTPHISGISRAKDIVKRFMENYEKYKNNKPLLNVVDFDKGY
ncbi:glyoxylate/hydroxypyruvate reductase A-like isoform X2 [Schistocerca serialis cubense]|uniref:glyoxylate/hydroxypyruvate reductase A-like isoform X2 n=1 Tax=Schistocerca serialis cubense TaxID=2023355 RepID=UPI00214F4A10|nr:glyoxylate/hydroxypyruvate reductase A-like isoform X2 [Schistocerca serialis cubense]